MQYYKIKQLLMSNGFNRETYYDCSDCSSPCENCDGCICDNCVDNSDCYHCTENGVKNGSCFNCDGCDNDCDGCDHPVCVEFSMGDASIIFESDNGDLSRDSDSTFANSTFDFDGQTYNAVQIKKINFNPCS
ncbi:MAG: hypothetical protein JEZ05_10690 [Tenericutes bacterium]|nr:hypothetical protein [Mycoplasmatota bacterium]